MPPLLIEFCGDTLACAGGSRRELVGESLVCGWVELICNELLRLGDAPRFDWRADMTLPNRLWFRCWKRKEKKIIDDFCDLPSDSTSNISRLLLKLFLDNS